MVNATFARAGIFVLVAAAVILFDQITKAIVRANLPLYSSWPEDWPIRFTHLTNSGAAFGLFQNQSMVFVVIAFFAIGLIVYYYRRLPADAWMVRLALGLQLGGAAGNLIDRLHQGFVTDLLDVRFWPVFNFADTAISIGVVILAYYLLFVNRTESVPEHA